MDTIEEYYGKEAFTLYGLFALVPGKKRWPYLLFVLTAIILLCIGTICQVGKLLVERFRLEYLIDLIPTTAATFGTLVYVPYVAFATEHEYKVLLSIMLEDLRTKRSEEEEAIKELYTQGVRLFIKIYIIVLVVTICCVSLSGFLPVFLDLIIPLNESREVQFVVVAEFFIDKEKYFYHLYFTECCVVSVVCIVTYTSENMSVIIIQHICGMLAVIGYRFENITEVGKDKQPDKRNYISFIERRLRRCIVEYQKVLHYSTMVADFYDVPLTLILIGSFCTLTISLVQVMDPDLFTIKMMVIMVAQIFQLFLVSYLGQCLIDSSAEIAHRAYNAKWDICTENMRKLLQLTILRSSKPCKIVARGIYVLSFENFMSVMQSATSCFMVLRQTN